MSEEQPRHVLPEDRIATLDLLRGIALCGMLLINISFTGWTGGRDGPPLPVTWNADWIIWALESIFVEGSMRGLFTFLFGAGALLMLRRAEGASPESVPFDVWSRRCLGLMAFSAIDFGVLSFPFEVLWAYGMCGLALPAFRLLRPRTLFIIAAALICASSLLSGWQAFDDASSRDTPVISTSRAATTTHRVLAHPAVATGRSPHESEYAVRTHTISRLIWSTTTWAGFALGPVGWARRIPTLAAMLIGMGLFRSRILTGEASGLTYVGLIVIGYGGGVMLRVVEFATGMSSGLRHPGALTAIYLAAIYEPARLLITFGHVGLIITLWRTGALGKATIARSLGRMALTVYMGQALLMTLIFYNLGLLDCFSFAQLAAIAVLIWLITSVFCGLWLRKFDMGPVESMLRMIAYQRLSNPWRKSSGTEIRAI